MTMNWLKLGVALLTALVALFTWYHQRNKDRKNERNKLSALYVNPFLLACQELQSRIYNILGLDGLSVLRAYYPDKAYAEETLYLIAQYFGWERCIYRYGRYTQDARVIEITEAIRDTFATGQFTRDAFCFFRLEQRALGHMVMKQSAGEFGSEFETIPLYEFREKLGSASFPRMQSVCKALTALREAEYPEQLKGKARLAQVQNYLVDILSHIEKQEGFTLFTPGKRRKARMFGVRAEAQSDLSKGIVPQHLRQEFEDNDISLSDTPRASAAKTGDTWLITDKNNKYIVRKEGTELNVYSGVGE